MKKANPAALVKAETRPVAHMPPHNQTGPPSKAPTTRPRPLAAMTDDPDVLRLIAAISAGEIDAIAFTSKSQVERLAGIASAAGGDIAGLLEPVLVAAVGPVAARALEQAGVRVDAVPETGYFMKPMVSELMRGLGVAPADG